MKIKNNLGAALLVLIALGFNIEAQEDPFGSDEPTSQSQPQPTETEAFSERFGISESVADSILTSLEALDGDITDAVETGPLGEGFLTELNRICDEFSPSDGSTEKILSFTDDLQVFVSDWATAIRDYELQLPDEQILDHCSMFLILGELDFQQLREFLLERSNTATPSALDCLLSRVSVEHVRDSAFDGENSGLDDLEQWKLLRESPNPVYRLLGADLMTFLSTIPMS